MTPQDSKGPGDPSNRIIADHPTDQTDRDSVRHADSRSGDPTSHPRRRPVLTALAVVATFALGAGASWAITHDRSSDATTTSSATDGSEGTIREAPMVDDKGELVPVEADGADESVVVLTGARAITYDRAFDAIPAKAVIGAADTGSGPLVLDTPPEHVGTGGGVTPPTTDGPTTSTSSTTPPATSPTTTPATTPTGSDAESGTADGTDDRTTIMTPAFRFTDPCADDPDRCAGLFTGSGAVSGATVLPLSGGGFTEAVRIRGITVSSARSKGCSAEEVPDDHRAVEVTVNRPASLELRWTRDLEQAGEVHRVVPVPATLTDYREHPERGWTTCIDMAFPIDTDHKGASLTIRATVADGSSDTRTQYVFDDNYRRLLVFSVGKPNEVIAMTPAVGDVRLTAVALADGESEVQGCARAAARVLPARPAPGTEVIRGEDLSDEEQSSVVPDGGEWIGARFTGLGEAERYGVCMFSIGHARGVLSGSVEASDAVFVQPPNRERYEIRPVTFQRSRTPDRFGFEISINGTSKLCGWSKYVTIDDPQYDDIRDDFRPCEIGRLEAPERVVGNISSRYEGRTSQSWFTLPAHCIRPDDCAQLGQSHFRRLDVPGPAYGPDVCGAIGASCSGLRPRGVLDGTLTLSVRRVPSPVGPESWTIGPGKRVDVNIPEDHYDLVDARGSTMVVGIDGRVIIRIRTLVQTNVVLYPMSCDGGTLRTMDELVSVIVSTMHEFHLPDPMEIGQCLTATAVVSDPSTGRTENTWGMFPQTIRTE